MLFLLPGSILPYFCCCLVVRSCPILCDPMDCSTPGYSFLHHLLLKFMSTESAMLSNHLVLHHPLLQPSVFPRIRVFSNESVLHIRWPKGWSLASVLPVNSQDWFPVGLTGLISWQSKEFSRVFSNTIIQKHQFSAQLSLWSNFHIHTGLVEKP